MQRLPVLARRECLVTYPSGVCFRRMTALLFMLVRASEFELAVPAEDSIVPFGTFLQRPVLRDDKEEGVDLPLFIWPYKRI